MEEGLVKLSFFSQTGSERTVAFIRSGAMFGESAALFGRPYGITAAAHSGSTVISFTKPVVSELMHDDPEFSHLLITSLAQELWFFGHQIVGNSFYNSCERVAHALITLAYQLKPDPECRQVNLRLSHQELATFTGVTRITVTNALKTLESEALIQTGRKFITILDVKKLKSWLAKCTSI